MSKCVERAHGFGHIERGTGGVGRAVTRKPTAGCAGRPARSAQGSTTTVHDGVSATAGELEGRVGGGVLGSKTLRAQESATCGPRTSSARHPTDDAAEYSPHAGAGPGYPRGSGRQTRVLHPRNRQTGTNRPAPDDHRGPARRQRRCGPVTTQAVTRQQRRLDHTDSLPEQPSRSPAAASHHWRATEGRTPVSRSGTFHDRHILPFRVRPLLVCWAGAWTSGIGAARVSPTFLPSRLCV